MSERQRRVLGASVGGLTATALDIVVLTILVESGMAVALAAFLGAAAGAAGCFLLNKYVAFRDHRPVDLRQVVMFGGAALGTALFMAASMHVACVHGHVPYLAAKVLCGLAVFACWSYPVQRRFVFASPA
ncbi:MAG: GtrA family protein [Kofleriaceae bacterium]|nr:GtrA family protein [Kofleriaceae bacterium]MCL4223813.1 GtrA family protein [Myxococcales bacterium]